MRKAALQLCGVSVVWFAKNGTLIEMSEPIELPPEIEQVADLLSEQPLEVRDLFCYLLVMSMVDEHKARIVGVRPIRGRHYLRIETKVGDALWILRPPISMATELRMREEVQGIIEDRDD